VIKTPVPNNKRSIKGIDPNGTSLLGKFFILSKFPGKDQTVLKNSCPPKMKIENIIPNVIIPAVDFFILLYI
jgi:hypothetical protein